MVNVSNRPAQSRFSMKIKSLLALILFFAGADLASAHGATPAHTFEIGRESFILDGNPVVIRCGEIHLARVPRQYWQDRLRRIRAMGMNAVCAYLFWNYHEWEEGKYDWSGERDAAEFCRMAQKEGLWVILRPGPYACAEWEMGGLPWWLLKNDGVKLRTRDPKFMEPSKAWLKEVGRVLAPQQITQGGPILMVQVENEYGFYGDDVEYMKELRQATVNAGFDVPLFECNPRGKVGVPKISDLFSVVNFGGDPKGAFEALRQVQKNGPLMCGEFYPGWFDTWGFPHHLGNTKGYLADLEYMLKNKASFSIYMAHGGTSFGMWAGADGPFKPDTSSYDYDAPISEAGWIGEKFQQTRELMSRYLEPGEKLPDPPANLPVMKIPPFELTESAAIFENLPTPVETDNPRTMEYYNQGRGYILYRTTLPAGKAATLAVKELNDFAWVFADGKQVGRMDRRSRRFRVELPERKESATLDIFVEAMGRVNFGQGVHDLKGMKGPVRIAVGNDEIKVGSWKVYNLDPGAALLAGLKWKTGPAQGPAFWRSSFVVAKAEDTFFNLSSWGKGVLWINGHCLGRFWNIGPTQTMYVPGPWLKAGKNEVIVLDVVGPEKPVLEGLTKPILNQLRPELDLQISSKAGKGKLLLDGSKPILAGQFPDRDEAQTVRFDRPARGKQLCFEMLSSQDGKPFATIAELDLLDEAGNSISHANWNIAYVDSEELSAEDGSAANAINGQTSDIWHSTWSNKSTPYPHHLVLDLGGDVTVSGLRYTPRAGMNEPGRIKEYRIYIGEKLVETK